MDSPSGHFSASRSCSCSRWKRCQRLPLGELRVAARQLKRLLILLRCSVHLLEEAFLVEQRGKIEEMLPSTADWGMVFLQVRSSLVHPS